MALIGIFGIWYASNSRAQDVEAGFYEKAHGALIAY